MSSSTSVVRLENNSRLRIVSAWPVFPLMIRVSVHPQVTLCASVLLLLYWFVSDLNRLRSFPTWALWGVLEGLRGATSHHLMGWGVNHLIAFIIKLASATVKLSPLRSWLLVISLWWVFCYRQPWGCPTCQLSLLDCNGCGLGSPGFTWPSVDERVLCALCLEILGGKNQDFKIILLFSWLFNSIYWCYKVRLLLVWPWSCPEHEWSLL